MDSLEIKPKKLSGSVTVPPSKSMAHRAIICASLSNGISKLTNIDYSDDINATIEAMKSLGTVFIKHDNELIVDGNKTFTLKNCLIDCNESGSTLRFLVPISLAKENNVRFIGKGNLGKRPITTFYEVFDKQGIRYNYSKDELDLKIKGKIRGDIFKIRGDISSQFISGFLFALPLVNGDSIIEITTNLESKSYIDLTLSMLETFGISIINHNYERFIIKGNQQYKATNYEVEGDFSQGAFFYCANYIGNDIDINGLDFKSLQGDKQCVSIIEDFKNNDDKDVVIDATNCPDIIPVVCVSASLRRGKTFIKNAGRLRIKECDRLTAICTELSKLGANIREDGDTIIVVGTNKLSGGKLNTYNDHRMAMALAIASTRCEDNVIIDNKNCVSKSYPKFWEDFSNIGGAFR